MEILKVEHVTKRFARHTALDDVSLTIPKGSVYGLLGPNGAGKTTLIRIINRITAPDEGKVIFDGCEIQPQDVYRIGYLPEERGLYKKMKVGEQGRLLRPPEGAFAPRSGGAAQEVVRQIRHRIVVGPQGGRTFEGYGPESPVHRHGAART